MKYPLHTGRAGALQIGKTNEFDDEGENFYTECRARATLNDRRATVEAVRAPQTTSLPRVVVTECERGR